MKRNLLAMLLAAAILSGPGEAGTSGAAFADAVRIRTYTDTSVGGALRVPAEAAENVCFRITAEPVKGQTVVYEDGSFVYTPRAGKTGEDSFYYQVSDGTGRLFSEESVRIHIEEQKTGARYGDMQGRAEAYAAALLSSRGLFTGEQVAGCFCFAPEKPVTRGEFLSICMELSGKPLLSAACSTGFADDEAIPAWMKTYVLSASLSGAELHRGESFCQDEPIPYAEAADLVRQTLGVRAGCPERPDTPLTRAEMALLLLPVLTEAAG